MQHTPQLPWVLEGTLKARSNTPQVHFSRNGSSSSSGSSSNCSSDDRSDRPSSLRRPSRHRHTAGISGNIGGARKFNAAFEKLAEQLKRLAEGGKMGDLQALEEKLKKLAKESAQERAAVGSGDANARVERLSAIMEIKIRMDMLNVKQHRRGDEARWVITLLGGK